MSADPVMTQISSEAAAQAWEQAVASVWGHRFGAVSVRYESVNIGALNSVIGLVATDTFTSAQQLLRGFVQSGIAPYRPVMLHNTEGGTFLPGPLVERHPAGQILLDGVHRCLAALDAGMTSVWAAVLTTARRPAPPGVCIPLAAVTPTTDPKTRAPLFRLTNNHDFRPTHAFLAQAQIQLALRREQSQRRDP